MANTSSGGDTQRGGSGNFSQNPAKASEAGKKGGEHSHGGASSDDRSSTGSSSSSQRSGSGNFANDREKASEAGRKGGGQSHGGHGNAR